MRVKEHDITVQGTGEEYPCVISGAVVSVSDFVDQHLAGFDRIRVVGLREPEIRFRPPRCCLYTGYECGLGIKDLSDFQVGDIIEFFHREKAG